MSTKPIKLKDLQVFDPADHLQNEETIQAYLAEMARENNAMLLARALADVERARKRWGLSAPEPINVHELPSFDVTDFLNSEEAIQAFLADAKQDTEPGQLAIAQTHVDRARRRWNLPAPSEGSTFQQ